MSSTINKCLSKDDHIRNHDCLKILPNVFIPTLPTINEIKISIPNIICNKVDASNLVITRAPISLKQHDTLPLLDKITWNNVYTEEFFGLHKNTVAWEYISESDYVFLPKYTGNTLPTQELAVI